MARQTVVPTPEEIDERWRTATLNNKPIPVELRALLPWEYTDQGAAEANVGKVPARASVVRDSVDKEISRRADDLARMAPGDAGMASDPLRDRASELVRPGFTPRYLSKGRIDKESGSTRGYEVVRNEKGDAVQYKNLILAEIPTDTYIDRRAAVAARSRQALQTIKENAEANALVPVK